MSHVSAPAVSNVLSSPIVFSDFGDQTKWVPFGNSQFTVEILANGKLHTKMTGANDTNMVIVGGVRPRFLLYPDLLGALQFEIRIGDYVHKNAIGDKLVYGFAYEDNYNANLHVCGVGSVGNNASPTLYKLEQADPRSSAINMTHNLAIGAFSTLDLRVTLQQDNAGNPKRYFVGVNGGAAVFCERSIDGGAFGNFTTGVTTWPIGYNINRGLEVYLGIWGLSRLQDGEATIHSFKLNSGYLSFGR